MGANIHLRVEVRNPVTGKWELVRKMPKDYRKKWAMEDKAEGRTDGYWYKQWKEYEEKGGSDYWLYNDRNYDLFAILADVRNGCRSAVGDTSDGFNPIALPKGLPDDASDEVISDSEKWGEDGHSHSYLTLSELLNYNWDQVTTHRGWVSEEVYRAFKETGNPYPCATGVSGDSVVKVSNTEMDDIISGKLVREQGKRYYTQVEWTESYKDSVGRFYTECIPELKELAESPDDVRIVFWFDN